jgi:acyl-CoA synthetase (AMP-forming)/AMP-acid ligase II
VNLVDLIRYWGAWRPAHTALIFADQEQSWGELDHISDALARGLAAQGVGKGDRVGLLTMNRPELVHLTFAVLKLGAICVPLNYRLTATELRSLLEDADCRVVIAESGLLSLLEPSADLGFQLFAIDGGDARRYQDLLVDSGQRPVEAIGGADAAFICYTSGTTGVQKGALLTHASTIHPGQAKVVAEGLTWRDRMLVAVPLVYTGAMVSCLMQFVVYAGGTLVLEADFDPDRYLSVIERHRVSALTTVPVVWERLTQSSDFATRDITSLVSAAAGGAPVRLDLLETYRSKGITLIQSYGLTEASGLVTTMNPDQAVDYPGYAGRPILGTEVRIGDEEGETVPPGEIGEILVKGPHVMREYWRKPEATAETIVEGWLHSGDMGLQDEHGFVKVVDRTKDMLISGGLNVYPAEIERALAGIDGVIDLAVIGVPDETWGEVPLLVFHASADAATVIGQVEEIGRRDLAGYKRPKFAVVSDEPLPRTFSGKLAKPSLRAAYGEVPADAVALFAKQT